MIGHRTRFRENDDLPFRRDPAVKKQPSFFKRARSSGVKLCAVEMRNAKLGNDLKPQNETSLGVDRARRRASLNVSHGRTSGGFIGRVIRWVPGRTREDRHAAKKVVCKSPVGLLTF